MRPYSYCEDEYYKDPTHPFSEATTVLSYLSERIDLSDTFADGKGEWLRFGKSTYQKVFGNEKGSLWLPKIYLNLSGTSFLEAYKFIHVLNGLDGIFGKININKDALKRPDKLIFYIADQNAFPEFIRRISPLVKEIEVNDMAYAGIRKTAWGVRVSGKLLFGTDPLFIQESWRFYSITCMLWASKNQSFIKKELKMSEANWLSSMNIIKGSGGPVRLHPGKSASEYVHKAWKEWIFP